MSPSPPADAFGRDIPGSCCPFPLSRCATPAPHECEAYPHPSGEIWEEVFPVRDDQNPGGTCGHPILTDVGCGRGPSGMELWPDAGVRHFATASKAPRERSKWRRSPARFSSQFTDSWLSKEPPVISPDAGYHLGPGDDGSVALVRAGVQQGLGDRDRARLGPRCWAPLVDGRLGR